MMKKIVRLTEADLARLVKKVIRERDEQQELKDCLRGVVEFLFTPTITNDNGEVIDGGDLLFWNENKLPKKDDGVALRKFMIHFKEYMDETYSYVHEDEPCDKFTYNDFLPYILFTYVEVLNQKLSGEYVNIPQKGVDDNSGIDSTIFDMVSKLFKGKENIPMTIKRRMTEYYIIERMAQLMGKQNIGNFTDEFDFADHIIDEIVRELSPPDGDFDEEELVDYLKDKYSESIFDYYSSMS
jgi:hypothetical protein